MYATVFIALGVLLVLILGLMALFSGLKTSSPVTWILAAVILVVLATRAAVLFARPGSVSLQIEGTLGMPFVGEIIIDGQTHALRGVTPQSFDYEGWRADYVVIRTDVGHPGQLHVRAPAGFCTDVRGVKGAYERQRPFGSTHRQVGLGEQEWQETASRLLPQDVSPQASSPD